MAVCNKCGYGISVHPVIDKVVYCVGRPTPDQRNFNIITYEIRHAVGTATETTLTVTCSPEDLGKRVRSILASGSTRLRIIMR